MKFYHLLCLVALLMLNTCSKKSNKNKTPNISTKISKKTFIDSSITNPLETKKLKLLITNHLNTYFLEKGAEKGLEYELLQLYLKERKIDLDLNISHELEGIHDSIIKQHAHFASATFGIPLDTLGPYKMTDYLYTTKIVLVRRNETPSLVNSENQIKINLILDTPYFESLIREKHYDNRIVFVQSNKHATKQSLIENVANGEIDYTIASINEAEIMKIFYPNINISEVLHDDIKIGLMVHPKSTELLNDFNSWLAKFRSKSDFQWIIHKYHKIASHLAKTMTHQTPKIVSSKISEFDPLIKNHSESIGWDWKLLAALIYQESRFKPKVKSHVGAMGLMQVMPLTGKAYANVTATDLFIPSKNLLAGTKFIDWIQNNYFDNEMISIENRLKFTIASYNVGVGHLQDAIKLAKKYNLNPYVWDDNVEKMILSKSKPMYYRDPVVKHGYCRGLETVTYVKNINKYYAHYSNYINN